jgi:hypothetical protein
MIEKNSALFGTILRRSRGQHKKKRCRSIKVEQIIGETLPNSAVAI